MLFARMSRRSCSGRSRAPSRSVSIRRRLLLSGLGVTTLVSLLLAILAATKTIELWHIALGAFIGGTFWSIEFPTRRTLLGEIAGMERIGAAMGLDSVTNQITRMIGPAIGGLLLELFGLVAPFVVGLCSMLAR